MFGQTTEAAFHAFEIVEPIHALAAGAQFSDGLRPAEHQLTDNRQFTTPKVEYLHNSMAKLRNTHASPGELKGQPLLPEARQRLINRFFVVSDNRLPVRFLIAGVHQCVERER